MSKVDRFFRKKVEDVVLQPRSEAWLKLERNLSKKNKGLIWFRAAAALLLTGLLVTSIILLRDKGNQQVAEQVITIPSEPAESTLKDNNLSQSSPRQEIRKNSVPRKSVSIKKITEVEVIPQVIEEANAEQLKIQEPLVEEVALATSIGKPIVIEYTLESIQPQKKETSLITETSEKKNSLQKALDFARDAKNSDSPLGELRQAKDDLFAMSFRKDKQKKQ
jgi:hypothetical protein